MLHGDLHSTVDLDSTFVENPLEDAFAAAPRCDPAVCAPFGGAYPSRTAVASTPR